MTGTFATARRGFDATDSEYVLAQLVREIPVSAIARMMGRSLVDVQTVAAASVHAVERPPSPVEPIMLLAAPGAVEHYPEPKAPPPEGTMSAAAWWVAQRYGVTMADLRGPSHMRVHAHPRHASFWECAQILNEDGTRRFSNGDIGRWHGGRDNSTVHNGIGQHEKRIAKARAA